MKVTYKQVDKGLLWDDSAFLTLSFDKVKNGHNHIKKLMARLDNNFDPERKELMNKVLDYLSGFWVFKNSLEKDKSKIACFALVELFDVRIDIKAIKFRVKEACQYFRFKHRKLNYNNPYYEEGCFDLESSDGLEKGMELKDENSKIIDCSQKENLILSDVFPQNLYAQTGRVVEKEMDFSGSELFSYKKIIKEQYAGQHIGLFRVERHDLISSHTDNNYVLFDM